MRFSASSTSMTLHDPPAWQPQTVESEECVESSPMLTSTPNKQDSVCLSTRVRLGRMIFTRFNDPRAAFVCSWASCVSAAAAAVVLRIQRRRTSQVRRGCQHVLGWAESILVLDKDPKCKFNTGSTKEKEKLRFPFEEVEIFQKLCLVWSQTAELKIVNY